MKYSHGLAASTAALIILSALFAGCQKKVTKVESVPIPEAQAPQPASTPIDTSAFIKADLAGELASQAKEALQNIYFDFDRSSLKQDAIDRLAVIARFLMDHPEARMLITGNCDERGAAEYNMALGDRRAHVAKEYLVAYGVAANRIETTSYGEERPAISGCTDEPCHAKNRRDEFSLLARQAVSSSME